MAGWWHPIRTLAALAFGAMGAASLYLVCQLLNKDRPKVKPAPSYYKMPGGHKTMISGWQHPAVAAAVSAESSDDSASDTQQLLKPIEEEKETSSPQPTASPFLPARPAKSPPAVLQPSRETDEQREARLQEALREKANKTQNYSRVHAELLHTERTYIASLNNALTCYIQPIQAKINKGELKVTVADCQTIFANLQGILTFHELFQKDLIDGAKEEVGAIILKYADYLKMYTAYVTNYSQCVQLVNKLSMQKDFSKFLTQQRASKASNGLDLMSYLIQPIQRIPRYEMLLQQLIKYAPYKAAADSLTSALNKVHAVAVLVNERKREAENASIILEIQHTIKNRDVKESLLQPSRKMLKMAEVTLLLRESDGKKVAGGNGKRSVWVLLTDVLVVCKEDYEWREEVRGREVLRVSEGDGRQVEVVWREEGSKKTKEQRMVAEVESEEERQSWLQALRGYQQSAAQKS